MADTNKSDTPDIDVQKTLEKQIAELRKEITKINKSISARGTEMLNDASEQASEFYDTTRGSRTAQQLRTHAHAVSEVARENPGTTTAVVGVIGLLGFMAGFAIGQSMNDTSRPRYLPPRDTAGVSGLFPCFSTSFGGGYHGFVCLDRHPDHLSGDHPGSLSCPALAIGWQDAADRPDHRHHNRHHFAAQISRSVLGRERRDFSPFEGRCGPQRARGCRFRLQFNRLILLSFRTKLLAGLAVVMLV
ncbi:hypothetical protein NKJ01_06155 [Mesorhizobium sp. M0276]